MNREQITAAITKFRARFLREKEIEEKRYDVECDLEEIAEIIDESKAAIAEEQDIIDRANVKRADLEELLEKLNEEERKMDAADNGGSEGDVDDETLDDIFGWVYSELEDDRDRSAEALASVYLMEKWAEQTEGDSDTDSADGAKE